MPVLAGEEMIPNVDIGEYVRLGGVYRDIAGDSPREVFESLSCAVSLPPYIKPRQLCEALAARESVLSTAIGKGIAIPHSQHPMIKNMEEQRIFICYLKNPVDMHSLDNKRVHTMIIPMSCNAQSHLHIISKLTNLLSQPDFRQALELRFGLEELYPMTKQF